MTEDKGIRIDFEKEPGCGRVQWLGPKKLSPAWFTLPLMAAGASLLYAAFECLTVISRHNWLAPAFGALMCAFLGGVFAFAGAMTLRMLVKLPGTVRLEKLSKQLGKSPDAVREEAIARGITPPYSINGQDYYRPEDFTATSLLRSAESAAGQDHLLRPAVDTEVASDQLVRASRLEEQIDEQPTKQYTAKTVDTTEVVITTRSR